MYGCIHQGHIRIYRGNASLRHVQGLKVGVKAQGYILHGSLTPPDHK
jgi:hypothetical protein